MAQYTPDEFGDVIDRFARGLPEAINRAELVATQQLKGDISGRIHRRGGTKDISGATRQYKSEQHKKFRKSKGKQISVVDHTITGDLRRSYKIFDVQKGAELRIFGDLQVKKARGNEDEYSSGVWEASKKEDKNARRSFNKEINKYIDKFFD